MINIKNKQSKTNKMKALNIYMKTLLLFVVILVSIYTLSCSIAVATATNSPFTVSVSTMTLYIFITFVIMLTVKICVKEDNLGEIRYAKTEHDISELIISKNAEIEDLKTKLRTKKEYEISPSISTDIVTSKL
jgi:hypothetical protein